MSEALILLALLSAVGAGCYYGGWRSAQSYLHAAKAVSDLTNAVAATSNSFARELERSTSATEAAAAQLAHLSEINDARQKDVEGALIELFQGFERAGLVRRERPTPGRQVGETPPSD